MRHVREDWPQTRPRGHADRCSCPGCRNRRVTRYVDRLASQSLSTALRHAQDPWEDAWESGPPSSDTVQLVVNPITWSKPATVSDLINKRSAAFESVGGNRVYKITRDGKPLYVGGAWGARQSVAGRIRQHVEGHPGTASQQRRSEEKQLRKAIKDQRTTTYVQYADVVAPRSHRAGPKYTHAIELLLATLIGPSIYVPYVVSFEDEHDA